MDPRLHVREALVRLLAREGVWPPADIAVFRNLLLDEAGGDFKQLVAFLVQLGDGGVPDSIQQAVQSGASWRDTSKRIALDWSSERFVQPEMSRWGVDAWGAALRAPGANDPEQAAPASLSSSAARAVPSPAPTPTSGSTVAGARRGAPTRLPVQLTGTGRSGPRPSLSRNAPTIPAWVKPSKVPPVARWIQGSHLSAPTPGAGPSGLSRADRSLMAILGLVTMAGVGLATLIRSARPGDASRLALASVASASAESLQASHRSLVRADHEPRSGRRSAMPSATRSPNAPDSIRLVSGEVLAGKILRVDRRRLRVHDVTRNVVFDEPLHDVAEVVLANGARMDGATIARTPEAATTLYEDVIHSLSLLPDGVPADSMSDSPSDAGASSGSSAFSSPAELLAGVFRLTVRRSGVYGDARCETIGGQVQWDQQTIETVRVLDDRTRFEFTSRPSVRGTVGSTGEFRSQVVHGERNGTRSAFFLTGRVTRAGFEALGETSTETTLRWRESISCRFVAELVGVRIR